MRFRDLPWGAFFQAVRIAIAVSPLILAGSAQAASWCEASGGTFHPLTAAERTAGWVSLFDGSNTQAWRGFHSDVFPTEGWTVEQGTLRHAEGDGRGGKAGGDLLSRETYRNFEFAADWCLQPGGNSGIKYLVVEEHTPKTARGAFGLEYQLIDDVAHSDAKQDNRKTAGVYDVAAPGPKNIAPAGQWNHLRIIVKGGQVEQFLNGKKVLAFGLDSTQFKDWVANSKYKTDARYGAAREGHIALQEHGSGVAFRNIKVRRIP
jgi:hypothetical protein